MKRSLRLGALAAAAAVALVSFAGTGVAFADPANPSNNVTPTFESSTNGSYQYESQVNLVIPDSSCIDPTTGDNPGHDIWASVAGWDNDNDLYWSAPSDAYDEQGNVIAGESAIQIAPPTEGYWPIGSYTVTLHCDTWTDEDDASYDYVPVTFTITAPTLSVTTPSVTAGGSATIQGDGMQCYYVDDRFGTATPATVTIAGVTATAGAPAATSIPGLLGAWTATVAIPASTPPGTYSVTGSCTNPVFDYAAGSITVTPAPLTAFSAIGTATITGTAAYGKTLTAHTSAWAPAASGYSYTWFASGKAIAGQSKATLKLAAAQVAKKITVTVTAQGSDQGSSFTGTSAASKATKAVSGSFTAAKPKITGTVKVGKTVKVSVGTWKPVKPAVKIQWLANGKAVKGATKSSLKISKALAGKKLTVKVTGSKTGWTTLSATSAAKKVAR